MSMGRTVLIATAAALFLGGGRGGASDDDLAVVKRATTQTDPAGPEREKEGSAQKVKATSPQWLKVRIVEKSNKKARVSINLPLAIVRAFGDDCPLDWHGKAGREGPKVRLSDILKALEAGQQIVEIDDEESTIRVWVE
jgi:hypothetical protein